jgi:hypothetical protein
MSVTLAEVVPGLYQAEPASAAQETFAYYLLTNPSSPTEPLTLDQTWNDKTLAGWYIFLPYQIPSDRAEWFAEQARQHLPPLTTSPSTLFNKRAIVWLTGIEECANPTSSIVFYQLAPSLPQRAPVNTTTFQWSNLSLTLTPQTNIALDTAGGVFSFTAVPLAKTAIQLSYNDQSLNDFYIIYGEGGGGWQINVPLTGDNTGALSFTLALDWGKMCQGFGCGFSYFYPSAGGYSNIFYPLFPPKDPNNSNPATFLGLNIILHPLYPTDARQTRFALDLTSGTQYAANCLALSSNYFQTVSGAAIQVVPTIPNASPPDGSPDGTGQVPAGFALCKAPAGGSPLTSPPDYVYYLAPVGLFSLASVMPPGAVASPETDDVQMMCGLFAQEFLQVQVGDFIEFTAGQPAWAHGFTGAVGSPLPSSSSAEALTPDFTTSWVRYPVGDPEELRGYFGQPSASVYYAPLAGQDYPGAVNSLLSTFPQPVTFPLAPYGGIYQQSTPFQQIRYNVGVSPDVIRAFESSVLSNVRHAALATSESGPTFLSQGTLPRRNPLHLMSAAEGAPSTASSALTPQGLLVRLNPAGTWNRVLLAKSPDTDHPENYLEFGPPPQTDLINPSLSNVLLRNQLFLVVTNPAALGTFAQELFLCGFNFRLDVDVEETILIFKYNTSASLRDLVSQTSLWAESETFVGGSPSDVEAAQSAILDYINYAEDESGASGNPFGYFNNTIANDPAWTGILAMHCAIDGNNMPPDLTMLLGGISGQLRAHHFGVETNRIWRGGDSPDTGQVRLELEESSLFGVIFYQEPSGITSGQADFDYEVVTLTVVFSNSGITQFAAKVGLTIHNLFGRGVKLISEGGVTASPADNTLIISGQYQSQDGVGTLTFVTDEPIVYDFPVPVNSNRVLDRIVFTQASLAPVNAGGAASPSNLLQADFALGGQLWFSADPFPGSDGLDLFSYGTSGAHATGAAFTGLVVNISFQLDQTGSVVPGSKVLALQPSLLSITPAAAAIRPGSLLNSLPLQLSRFWYSPDGLTAAQLGAVPIHVLQLEGDNGTASPPPTGKYPFVTSVPQYALEYDLPLGTLGSLSNIHGGLLAKLLLAWGPSQIVPEADAAAVLVQLPEAMVGYGGFDLQGILKTTFGDANLLKVDLSDGTGVNPVYAILFNNIQLSIFGFSFPPGVLIDFAIFAGKPQQNQSTNTSNIAWFLAAMQPGGSPSTS